MITPDNNDILSNNSGADLYNHPAQPHVAGDSEYVTSEVLQEDDLHEVQVNDDLNEPDPETAPTFDKDNTSTPDEVQGEGTDLDSMDNGNIAPATEDRDDKE